VRVLEIYNAETIADNTHTMFLIINAINGGIDYRVKRNIKRARLNAHGLVCRFALIQGRGTLSFRDNIFLMYDITVRYTCLIHVCITR